MLRTGSKPEESAEARAETRRLAGDETAALVRQLVNLATNSNNEWWATFAAHLCEWAPVLLAPAEPSKSADDGSAEAVMNEILLRPVLALLANNSEARNLSHVVALLKDPNAPLTDPSTGSGGAHSSLQDKPPGAVCGHVFKQGEPTYTCRQCAVDGTCVLCHRCFEASRHKAHKYRMHTSSGGTGYCDCGDPEAWTADVSCSLHAGTETSAQPMDTDGPPVCDQREQATVDRLKPIMMQLLRFTLACLLCESSDDLPDGLALRRCQKTEGVYVCMLYNDETHTYDGVIRALKSATGCSEEQAMLLATVVDREGRCVVRVGSLEECERVRDDIGRKTERVFNERTGRRGPLQARATPADLAALQTVALAVDRLLAALAYQSGLAQRALADCLLKEEVEVDAAAGGRVECVAAMLLRDHALWKSARGAHHQLMTSALLIAPHTKAHFARIFTRHYLTVTSRFVCDDDHEHSASAVALTVQIYTVPSIAKCLMANPHCAGETVLRLLNRMTLPFVAGDRRQFDFNRRTYPARLRRALYALTDLK